MIDADDREAWANLLARLDEPNAQELAARLVDTFDVSRGRADETVFEAIDDGPLVEDTEAGGAYGVVRLAESDETPKTGELNPNVGIPLLSSGRNNVEPVSIRLLC